MFKALLLQSLYGLSDPELEDALGDRLSFRRFVGLSLEDPVPDHSTICRFRNAMVAAGLMEKLFGELDRQLEKAGVVLKRGTMLDATVIATGASGRPPKGGEAHDPQAGFAKRQGRAGVTFGYKAHVGVDEGSGLIRSVITTAANVPDTVPADGLIRGDERSVLAEAAYHTGQQASSRPAEMVEAAQPSDRAPARRGGDDLRHLEAADGLHGDPLRRPRQGVGAGDAGGDGLQPAPLGDAGRGLNAPGLRLAAGSPPHRRHDSPPDRPIRGLGSAGDHSTDRRRRITQRSRKGRREHRRRLASPALVESFALRC